MTRVGLRGAGPVLGDLILQPLPLLPGLCAFLIALLNSFTKHHFVMDQLLPQLPEAPCSPVAILSQFWRHAQSVPLELYAVYPLPEGCLSMAFLIPSKQVLSTSPPALPLDFKEWTLRVHMENISMKLLQSITPGFHPHPSQKVK